MAGMLCGLLSFPLYCGTIYAREQGVLSLGAAGEPLLQPLWRWLLDGPLGSVTGSAAFPGVLSLAFYFVTCLPMFLLDILDLPAMRKYKIRGEERPVATEADWWHCVEATLSSIVVFIVPGVGWQLFTQGPWMYRGPLCLYNCHGKDLLPAEAPPLLELCLHVILCLVVFDLSYFLWHRSHHVSRLLYRHIHAKHHEYHAPFVWVTQYVHPCELFAVSAFSMLVPIGLGAHPLAQWLWLLLSVQFSVEAHGGYDFPFSIDKFLPGLGGPVHHDRHHEWPMTNFQPFLTYGDRYLGSDYDMMQKVKLEKLHQKAQQKNAEKEE